MAQSKKGRKVVWLVLVFLSFFPLSLKSTASCLQFLELVFNLSSIAVYLRFVLLFVFFSSKLQGDLADGGLTFHLTVSLTKILQGQRDGLDLWKCDALLIKKFGGVIEVGTLELKIHICKSTSKHELIRNLTTDIHDGPKVDRALGNVDQLDFCLVYCVGFLFGFRFRFRFTVDSNLLPNGAKTALI